MSLIQKFKWSYSRMMGQYYFICRTTSSGSGNSFTVRPTSFFNFQNIIMKVSSKFILTSIIIVSFTSCTKGPYNHDQTANESISPLRVNEHQDVQIFKAAGNIDSALQHFRDLLGQLNVAPGVSGGRREVNWDAVPIEFTNNDHFPGNFFAASDPALPNGRKRGIFYTTPGTGFIISDNDFEFINPSYPAQFKAFSPKKTFMPANSNIVDNFFKVPGTEDKATIQGFGVVFSDVNNASSTSIEYYNGDRLLGSFKVPNVGNNNPGGFSFLGVYFPDEQVSRVRIVSGNAALSPTQNDLSDGGGKDLAVMDDFIYSEPVRQ